MSIIISDNIEKECLNLISIYKDEKYVKDLLLEYYPRLSKAKQKTVTNQVISHINQGLEMYMAADNNLYTAPLLLFYSINNFAKAVFYIKNPNLSFSGKHGLQLIGDNTDGIYDIGGRTILIESSGIFPSLLPITKDELQVGDRLRIKDVYAVIPELCSLYAVRYMEEPNVFLLRQYKNNDGMYEIEFQTNDSDYIKSKDYSYVGENGLRIYISQFAGKISGKLYKTEACTDENYKSVIYHDAFGNKYLTSGFKNGEKHNKLSKFVSLYLVYYAYSMYSRYHPEEWMEICNKADAAIINKLVLNMRIDMLIEVIQLLSCNEICFATKLPELEKEMDMHELWNGLKSVLKEEKIRSGKSPLAFLE